jgi:hypothetical protein
MKQQKIVKRTTRCTLVALDLRSPAGLLLPY